MLLKYLNVGQYLFIIILRQIELIFAHSVGLDAS